MVRFRLADILEDRGWTAHRLAQETDPAVPAGYRLADPGRHIQLDISILDTICRVLRFKPGDLLQYIR